MERDTINATQKILKHIALIIYCLLLYIYIIHVYCILTLLTQS